MASNSQRLLADRLNRVTTDGRRKEPHPWSGVPASCQPKKASCWIHKITTMYGSARLHYELALRHPSK